MKILVVMGSPRKGNTYRAAERIREILQSFGPAEFEYLWLREENLGFCRGCFTCIIKGEENCPVKDSAPAILQKMQDADGVIFASPVYGMNVSGLFKVFVDRFAYIFHRPRFFDKKALLLTTTGAVGAPDVLKYLRLTAQVWGFEVAGEAGLITPPGKIPEYRQRGNEEICQRAAALFHAALVSPCRKSPGLNDVIIFHAQRGSFGELREQAPVDYEYWKAQGWLEPGVRYYARVPVNPLYTVIGLFVEYMARQQIRKDAGAK